MKVLLIWEEVPERISPISLEGELAELALKCAGKYINGDDLAEDDPIFELNEKLEEKSSKSLDINSPIKESFDAIVICGCIM